MATSSSGAVKRGMRDYVLNLDGVNEQHIDTDGDFFHVQTVSVGGTSVSLRFDDGPAVVRTQGQGNRVYYSRVSVTASAACTVVLQLGYGYATDSRATLSANITTTLAPAVHNPGVPAVNVGAASQAPLVAADANMIEIGIGIDSTQPNGVWIGDITVAANLGLFVEPGQIVWVGTQAAVYAFNAGAGAVKVSLMKTRNV